MSPKICSRDGHTVEAHQGYDVAYCPDHGSPLFENCAACGTPWQIMPPGAGRTYHHEASRFCPFCSFPAPWVSRTERLQSIKDRLTAAGLDPETALQLREVLDKLMNTDANDTKTVEAWRRLRDAAPKVWDACRPVLQTVVGEGVKKLLGL
jgi:hypothetical protein